MEKITVEFEDFKNDFYGWIVRFPECKYNEDQAKYLLKSYYSDLVDEGVNKEQFKRAVKHINKNNRFFPKMVDILTAIWPEGKRFCDKCYNKKYDYCKDQSINVNHECVHWRDRT